MMRSRILFVDKDRPSSSRAAPAPDGSRLVSGVPFYRRLAIAA